MSFVTAMISIHIVLILAWALSKVEFGWRCPKCLLGYNYMLVLLSLLLPGLLWFLPDFQVIPKGLEYTGLEVREKFGSMFLSLPEALNSSSSALQVESSVPISQFQGGSWLFILGGLYLLLMIRWAYLNFKLMKQLQSGHTVRRIGQVSVISLTGVESPFAYSFLKRSWIVVGPKFLEDRSLLRTSLLHELQHLRQGDLFAAQIFSFLRILFFGNPVWRVWQGEVTLLQEHVCDLNLVLSKKVQLKSYASQLFDVALNKDQGMALPNGAVAMALLHKKSDLTRRIVVMKNYNDSKFSKTKGLLATLFCATALIAGASVVHATIKGKISKLSVESVKQVVNPNDFSDEFQFEITDEVVHRLNEMTRTKKGKKAMKIIFKRLDKHKAFLTAELKKKGLPLELLAVPFVESGYRSVPPRPNGYRAAGMWQFIPGTAKKYGLQVNSKTDERMKLSLETPAALTYLSHLNSLFSNWELALLSYNMGESRVKKELELNNVSTAWGLIQKGVEGDKGYLSKVIAAAILLKYPQI